MLLISNPLSAPRLLAYHAEEFTNVQGNAYTSGERVWGMWHGRLARQWGLRGEVGAEEFRRLAEGQHPTTGEQLVRPRSARTYTNAQGERVALMAHRAALDATFSAPKSVSVAALLGEDERVRDAHRASVRVAMNEMEPYVQARAHATLQGEPTGNWVAAMFEHDSARPVDGYAAPHLHTHAVLFNLTRTASGAIRSVQDLELHRTQRLATAVYRAELGVRLRALGYEIERGMKGQPEITGFTAEYLEACSPRGRQIRNYLEERQLAGDRATRIAADQTREPKRECSRDAIELAHRELAARFGDQPREVAQRARERAPHLTWREPLAAARAAVAFAQEQNVERGAAVDERNLLHDALVRSMGEVTVAGIRAELARRLEAGEVIGLARTARVPDQAFSTRTHERSISRGRAVQRSLGISLER